MSGMNGMDLLAELIRRARTSGADGADAVLITGTALAVQRRLGRIEHLQRSESQDIGLRVFVGQRSAIVSASTLDPARFAELAARAVEMARLLPEDPYAGLAENPVPPEDATALDLEDPIEPATERLIEQASVAEEAALAVPGVTNSEGAEASFGRSEMVLVSSTGFAGRYVRTSHAVSVTALAGQGTAMQRDYDYATAVHFADLESAAAIGRSAGERAVARLHPHRPRTAKLPVVFEARVAASLLGHFANAINGAAIARGTSFLKDKLGQRVFAPGIFVHDDARRKRGLRSRPFDAEGTPTAARTLVADGMLTSWLLDLRSARQLGLASTGHAVRGTQTPPSPAPSNLYLAPGPLTPRALMADITEGFYVTELIGMGVNMVTGDYSRGAAGFMIRNGERAEPVAECTIAGNLHEMFLRLTPADDLRFRRGTDAPTVRIEGMTLAGA
jgi:PmbA protein